MSKDSQQFELHLEAVIRLFENRYNCLPNQQHIDSLKSFISSEPIKFHEMYRWFYRKEPQGYEVTELKNRFESLVWNAEKFDSDSDHFSPQMTSTPDLSSSQSNISNTSLKSFQVSD